MKPRNNFERELQAIIDGGRLAPLTKKQMQQAHQLWDTEENRKYKMMLYTTKQRINGIDLTKCYKAHQIGKRGVFTMYQLCIVKAERDGKTAWAARHTNMGYIIDSFSHRGELSIKNERDWFDMYVDGGFPLRSVGKADEYSVVRHAHHNDYEFRDNRVETLAKIGQEDIIRLMIGSERLISDKVYSAVKVAARHGYDFGKETWRWLDYVEMLILNGYDYRNPHYICPSDLTKAYYRLIDINDKRLVQVKANREKTKNEAYVKRIKKWLDMVISNGNIIIKPLQSIAEFEEEGKTMHHCVFANEYYKKAFTLILSAKDLNGNRLATIEYNLKDNKIIQCRAAFNKQPEQHDLICDLINEAMHQKTERAAA